jgi:hypothetical protein
MASGPLIHGIPFLPPGGKHILTWGTYQGLLDLPRLAHMRFDRLTPTTVAFVSSSQRWLH